MALAGLSGLGLVGAVPAALGWLVSFAVGAFLARARLRELENIAAWIERLPRGQEGPRLDDSASPFSGRLLRPVADLGRQLRRESRRMAAQQRMLATIIEALPDPILVVDQTLTVRQANAAARRSFTAPDPPVPLVRVLRDPGVLLSLIHI